MNDAWRFLLKGLLLGVLLVLMVGVMYWAAPPPDYSGPFGVIYLKQARLSKLNSPKVVILGGSNALIGIDSALLQSKLGRPVVNMGLQAGIPVEVQYNQVKPHLAPGDALILNLEYPYYTSVYGNDLALTMLLTTYPQALFTLDEYSLKQLPHLFQRVFQDKIVRLRSGKALPLDLAQLLDPVHHLPAQMLKVYNSDGDFLAYPDLPKTPLVDRAFIQAGEITPEPFAMLNRLTADAATRGVEVIVTFPAGRQANCDATAEAFDRLLERMRANLRAAIVGTPQAACYDNHLFMDTEYHLSQAGKQIRTERMAQDLQGYWQHK